MATSTVENYLKAILQLDEGQVGAINGLYGIGFSKTDNGPSQHKQQATHMYAF